MSCTFLFQDVFLEKEGAQWLPESLKGAGHESLVLSARQIRDFSASRLRETPVVAAGTIGFCREAKRHLDVLPGAYYCDTRFRCSTYLPRIPTQYLLNPTPLMIPYALLKANTDWYLNALGNPKDVFIRPDSGAKVFSGQAFPMESLARECASLEQITGLTGDTMVMVSKAQPILAEFRFVVVEGRVVTGSQYMRNSVISIEADFCPDCLKLADEIASLNFQIDTAYTCDVGLGSDGPRLIELNAFSTSGLYACDRMAAYQAVAVAAQKEFSGEISVEV